MEDSDMEFFGVLLLRSSKALLNQMPQKLLMAEVRSRGWLPGQLTKGQLVGLLLEMNGQLNKQSNKEQMVKKIHEQRKIWHTEWRILYADEEEEDGEDIQMQTSQVEENVCEEVENESQEPLKMGKSLEINEVPKGKSFATDSLPGKNSERDLVPSVNVRCDETKQVMEDQTLQVTEDVVESETTAQEALREKGVSKESPSPGKSSEMDLVQVIPVMKDGSWESSKGSENNIKVKIKDIEEDEIELRSKKNFIIFWGRKSKKKLFAVERWKYFVGRNPKKKRVSNQRWRYHRKKIKRKPPKLLLLMRKV
jgi:hypothetical protein